MSKDTGFSITSAERYSLALFELSEENNLLSQIEDQTKIPRAELMMQELYHDNAIILNMYKQAFHVAEEADEQGIADFIAGRIDAHAKHQWMLRSILKTQRA